MSKREVSLRLVSNESGDWIGLYAHDLLECEGHEIDWCSVIQKFRYFTGKIDSREISDEYMESGLPNDFNDIDPMEFI